MLSEWFLEKQLLNNTVSEWFLGKQLLNDNQVRKSHAEKATEGQPVGLIMLLARFVEEKSCKDRRERLLHWKAGRSQEGSGCHGDWVRLTLAHKGQCQHSPPEKPRQELIYTDSASWSLPQQRGSGMLITHQFEPITTNILWKVTAGLYCQKWVSGMPITHQLYCQKWVSRMPITHQLYCQKWASGMPITHQLEPITTNILWKEGFLVSKDLD